MHPSSPSTKYLYILPPQLPPHSSGTSSEVPGVHIEALCRRRGGRGGVREEGEEHVGNGSKCDDGMEDKEGE